MYFYKSTDLDAPPLTNSPGSINAVLKACLVDGYGSTPGAGWTVELENTLTYKTLFKNAGSGRRWLVTHDGRALKTDNANANLNVYTVRGCVSAVDINSLVAPFPLVADEPNAQLSQLLGVLGNTKIGSSGFWAVVADNKTAYIFTSDASSFSNLFSNASLIAIGDVEGLGANAASLPIAITHSSKESFTNLTYNSAAIVETPFYVERSLGGGSVSVAAYANLFYDVVSYYGGGSAGSVHRYPSFITNGMIKTPVYLREDKNDPQSALSFIPEYNWQTIFAKLRGIFQVPHAINAGSNFSAIRLGLPGDVVTDNGIDYLLLSSSSNAYSGSGFHFVLQVSGNW